MNSVLSVVYGFYVHPIDSVASESVSRYMYVLLLIVNNDLMARGVQTDPLEDSDPLKFQVTRTLCR